MGLITSLLTNTFLLYAGVRSFRALQSDSLDDDKQWLTFWLLFTLFEFSTTFADYTIGFVLPFYSLGKLAVVVALGLGGATLIYPAVEPLLLKADKVAQKYEKKASERLRPLSERAVRAAKEAAADAAAKMLKERAKDE